MLPEVEARWPPALGSYDPTQIIWASQMAAHHPDPNKFPDAASKVMPRPIELYDGEMAVHEIEEIPAGADRTTHVRTGEA